MRIRKVELQELVFRRLIRRSRRGHLHPDQLLRVEKSDEEIVAPGRIERARAIARETGDRDMSQIVHDRHPLLGSRQIGDGLELVRPLIHPAEQPVDDGIAARLVIVEVDHSDNLPLGGEIDLDGIVRTRERMPLHVTAIRAARPDAGGKAFVHDRPVLLHHLVSLAPVAPIEPAVRVQERTMHIGRVARVIKAADDHLAPIGHAVVVGVG